MLCLWVITAVRTVSEKTSNDRELSVSDAAVHRLAKGHQHKDQNTKRQQTIAVPDEVAEAVASHSSARRGRAAVQRDLSMKLPASSGQQDIDSELRQAFTKFHRLASQIAQSYQNRSTVEHDREDTEVQGSVEKPPKTIHSISLASHKLDPLSSQLDTAGLPQLSPAWKSMSSLDSDEIAIQKPSSTKNHSVAEAISFCNDGSSVSAICNEHSATGETTQSADINKYSPSAFVLRNTGKEDTKLHHYSNASSATDTLQAEKSASVGHPGGKSEPRSLAQTSSLSANSEITATDVPKLDRCRDSVDKKQMPRSTAAETVTSTTSSLVQKINSAVNATSETGTQQPSTGGWQVFARQKSCPEKTEHHTEAGTRRSVEGLRSSALWTTDESGNKLEIKLKKSHSIALKPVKTSPSADAYPTSRPALLSHKRTASTVDSSISHPPQHQDKTTPVAAHSSTGGTSVYQSGKAQLADSCASGNVEHTQLLKSGKAVAEKRTSSVPTTSGRCEDTSGEPAWLALARQKKQRWTEGIAMEECSH